MVTSKTTLALRSGCELFMRHVTRTFVEFPGEFQACKEGLLRRGVEFAQLTERSRLTIARLGAPFIHDGSVVLLHGRSRVVAGVLMEAARVGQQFSVIITECSPARETAKEQVSQFPRPAALQLGHQPPWCCAAFTGPSVLGG